MTFSQRQCSRMYAVSISLSKWPMLQTMAPRLIVLSMAESHTPVLPVQVTRRSVSPRSRRSMSAASPVFRPSRYGETTS